MTHDASANKDYPCDDKDCDHQCQDIECEQGFLDRQSSGEYNLISSIRCAREGK